MAGGVEAPSQAKKQSWPTFQLPSRVTKGADGAVPAIMNYQAAEVTACWTRRDASGSDDELHGVSWDAREVFVKDGRRAELTLDKNGFELRADARGARGDLVDYYDEAQILSRYYSQCESLVREATGASFVRAFDHNVRCETGRALGRTIAGGNAVQGPASLVHGDYTSRSAPRRLALLGQGPSANDPLAATLGAAPLVDSALADAALAGRRRFAFVNVWRPIGRPVLDTHLACADAATVAASALVPFEIVYADRVGENYFAKHSESHAWYYFPAMSPDEVLLLKQWDSHGAAHSRAHAEDCRRDFQGGSKTGAHQGGGVDGAVMSATASATVSATASATTSSPPTSTFALHSAFRDPTAPPDAPDRESIEVRLVLIFDDA